MITWWDDWLIEVIWLVYFGGAQSVTDWSGLWWVYLGGTWSVLDWSDFVLRLFWLVIDWSDLWLVYLSGTWRLIEVEHNHQSMWLLIWFVWVERIDWFISKYSSLCIFLSLVFSRSQRGACQAVWKSVHRIPQDVTGAFRNGRTC